MGLNDKRIKWNPNIPHFHDSGSTQHSFLSPWNDLVVKFVVVLIHYYLEKQISE